jgi:hypothetical protein
VGGGPAHIMLLRRLLPVSLLKSRVTPRPPDLRRCELSHAMSSRIRLKLVSFLQNAAIPPLATYPIAAGRGTNPRKVPSCDGYPRRSSRIVQRRWEMKTQQHSAPGITDRGQSLLSMKSPSRDLDR